MCFPSPPDLPGEVPAIASVLRFFREAFSGAFDLSLPEENERQRQNGCTDKTGDEDPALKRCLEDDFGASCLLSRIGFVLGRRGRLRGTLSNHSAARSLS